MRVFHSFERWEDSAAGLYELPCALDSTAAVASSASLLRCEPEFYCTALQMISEWVFAAEQNLSNKSRNRQAWIGQASCCFAFGAREHQVKQAWHMLNDAEKEKANQTADDIIRLWESVYA